MKTVEQEAAAAISVRIICTLSYNSSIFVSFSPLQKQWIQLSQSLGKEMRHESSIKDDVAWRRMRQLFDYSESEPKPDNSTAANHDVVKANRCQRRLQYYVCILRQNIASHNRRVRLTYL